MVTKMALEQEENNKEVRTDFRSGREELREIKQNSLNFRDETR